MKLMYTLSCFIFCLLFLNTKAQNYKYTYYLDEDLFSTSESKAVLIGKGFYEDGLFRVDCFRKTDNTLAMVAHFTDSALSDLHGNFRSFYDNTIKKSEGKFEKSLEEGIWLKWDEDGKLADSSVYQKGRCILTSFFHHYQNGRVAKYEISDSIADKYYQYNFNEAGIKTAEVFFSGDKGIRKLFDSSGNFREIPLYTKERKDATFPGGAPAFKKFLEQNLDAATPMKRNAPAGTYTVVVRFIVDLNGEISQIQPETKFGYGMENEVTRVIQLSKKWDPATEFGYAIRAYRRQPITFVIAEE